MTAMTATPTPATVSPAASGRQNGDALRSWPEGIDLPPYSPWQRIPEWEPHGLWLRDRPQVEWPHTVFSVTRAPRLLRGLLVISLILGEATMGGSVGRHLLAAGLTVVLAGWMEWWQRWDLTALNRRLLIMAVQLALVGGIVAISPLGGIIIWAHYMLCGTFFTGPWLLSSLVATCALITVVQVGGFNNVGDSWTLSLGLFLFDLAIGLVSITMANRREEAVLRRNEITRRLLIEHHRNDELHDQLMAAARERGVREERARLARELHDTVAQGLVAVVTQLEAIPDDAVDAAARVRVENAKALAREGLGEARRAVNALRPTALDDVALPDAIRRMVQEWSRVNAVEGIVTVSGEPRGMAADPELIRVVQEALSNVARHAGASRVAVSLDYLDDEVLLDVHDDGVGFSPACTEGPTEAGGRGLPGMAERLRLVGGSLAVESETGSGCVVSAVMPG